MAGLRDDASPGNLWARHLRGIQDAQGAAVAFPSEAGRIEVTVVRCLRPGDRGVPVMGAIPCLHPAGRAGGVLGVIRPGVSRLAAGRATHPGLAGPEKVLVIHER